MKITVISEQKICAFHDYLVQEEKSRVTVEKYIRDVKAFGIFLTGRKLSKEITMEYKQQLIDAGYAPASINSMLASLNSFFAWIDRRDCCVKNLRVQHQAFCSEENELTKEEYFRLLDAAEKNPRLSLLLQTICGTGIRVSELKYFTVEAIRCGKIIVSCKNKTRTIIIDGKLKKKLLQYARECRISSGIIFRTRSGKALDRSNIWSAMKKLCAIAKVNPSKVFPHNLRKLFARMFYKIKRDIAKLADVLGHSSIETTRIYIIDTGVEHRQTIESLGLVI